VNGGASWYQSAPAPVPAAHTHFQQPLHAQRRLWGPL